MGKFAVNGIIVVVAVTWAASIVVGMLKPSYTPPPTVHLAMMAIVGALFGRQVLGKAYSEDAKRDDPNAKRADQKPPESRAGHLPGKRE